MGILRNQKKERKLFLITETLASYQKACIKITLGRKTKRTACFSGKIILANKSVITNMIYINNLCLGILTSLSLSLCFSQKKSCDQTFTKIRDIA